MLCSPLLKGSQAKRQQNREGKWYSSTITDDDDDDVDGGGATHRSPLDHLTGIARISPNSRNSGQIIGGGPASVCPDRERLKT